jgi:hypothetical protein
MLENNDLEKKEEDIGSSQLNNSLSKSQKIAAASLAFFAVLVIILWVVQFNRSIKAPFTYQGESNNQATDSTAQAEADNGAALKQKDTDGDGLSDWDELNIYKTSPYLEDSDSDGFTDKEEIVAGTDPNCPKGQDCSDTNQQTTSENLTNPTGQNQDNSTLNNLLNQMGATTPAATLPATASTSASGSSNLSQDQLQRIISGNVDALTLRQILISAGMDKTVLDKISDEELMKSYQETMKQ